MAGAVLVIGAGRLGSALAVDLARAGWQVHVLVRDALRCQALAAAWPAVDWRVNWPGQVDLAVVLAAVPDREIAAIAKQALESHWLAPCWLHLAGALPGCVLRGVPGDPPVGSLHPLAAVRGPATPSPLRGALFAVGGDAVAQQVASQLASDLGGYPAPVADNARAAYHAAAALVANDWVALLAAAEQVAGRAGLDAGILRQGLVHLARTTLAAVALLPADMPAVAGATGAVARADSTTLLRHMAVLQADPAAATLHRAASVFLAGQLVAEGLLTGAQGEAVVAAVSRPVPGGCPG